MLKKISITALPLVFIVLFLGNNFVYSTNEDFLGKNKVKKELKGGEVELAVSLESGIRYLLGFLFFIMVVYGMWGGFQILTATSNDEKVKKGKTIVIQGIIGIIIVISAGYIVGFFIGGTDENGNQVNGLFDGEIN